MRIALGLEYDGSAFHGWQSQEGVRTLQDCVESALGKVADHRVAVVTAGRTDAGVHASGQVVHFDSDARRPLRAWLRGGNSHLPAEIRIQWAAHVAPGFHARFSARSRHYRYLILNRPVPPAVGRAYLTWEYRPLDERGMAAAAKYLVGEHDFSSYRAVACQAKSPVRNLFRLDVCRRGEQVIIDAVANAFLHHMVRNIAGVLMAIGAGEREPYWAYEVLDRRDRSLGGVTAPPEGLHLIAVEYPERFALPISTRGDRRAPEMPSTC